MTLWILKELGLLRGPLWFRALGCVIVLCLLPIALLVDVLHVLWVRVRWRRILRTKSLVCPVGHVVPLEGAWQCESWALAGAGMALRRARCAGPTTST